MIKRELGDNAADTITGERIFPNEVVWDTGIKNLVYPFDNYRTHVVKESTIVWLAEKAGLIVKRDVGDSGNSEVLDAGDVESGNGEVKAGKVKAGRRKSVGGSVGSVED